MRIREVLLRTMFSLLGALAGGNRLGLELELAILGRQPELYLRAARLLADGGHLPCEVFLEAVEIDSRNGISRSGGEPLIERFDPFRIDAIAEDDPAFGIETARGGSGHRPGGEVPPFLQIAYTPVEQLVVAVEPRLEVSQPEVVHGGQKVHAAQIAELRLHAAPQLVRREGQGAVEKALEIDAEPVDVATDLIEGLAQTGDLAPAGSRHRGGGGPIRLRTRLRRRA